MIPISPSQEYIYQQNPPNKISATTKDKMREPVVLMVLKTNSNKIRAIPAMLPNKIRINTKSNDC